MPPSAPERGRRESPTATLPCERRPGLPSPPRQERNGTLLSKRYCYPSHKPLSLAGPNMSRRSSPKVLRTFNYRHVPTHAEWQPAMEGPSGHMKTPVCPVWMNWRLSTRMGLQTTAPRRVWVSTISSRTSPILVNSRQACTTAHMQGAAWSRVPKVRSALADIRHGCQALIPLSMATMFANKSSK
jgi:hypothetical protein